MKKCLRCKQEKSRLLFGDDMNRIDGLCIYCLRCRKEMYHEKRRSVLPNGKWHRRRDKIFRRKKNQYKVYPEQFHRMLSAQGGKCAVCNEPFINIQQATVDHCHSSGRIRSLLCVSCNAGLGNFKDNPDLLRRAIEYINEQKRIESLGEPVSCTSDSSS